MRARKKMVLRQKRTTAMILILLFGLGLAAFAWIYFTEMVEDNLFHTGNLTISLNGGKPIIEEDEFLFEPGMIVRKTFFIENESSTDVYYKIYFQNMEGGLAEFLEVTIMDDENIIFEGVLAELTKEKVAAADEALKLGERKTFQIDFYFPDEAGNAAQNLYLNFELAAVAVQTKNNTEKDFES